MKNVLLVCTGNTCRSSMAEALLRNMLEQEGLAKEVSVASAGISALPSLPASPEAIKVLARGWQLDLSGHCATLLTRELITDANLILTMSAYQRHHVLAMISEAEDKVFLLSEFAGFSGDVSDPIGGDSARYLYTAKEIEGYLQKALPKLIDFLALKEEDN